MPKATAILIGLILIIISAHASFTVPVTLTGIPFTLQSLVVFVVAAFLRPSGTLVCLMAYLVLGAIGLPIFAEGTSGMDKIIGSSGGFLYGFLFSGLWISYSLYDKRPMGLTYVIIIFLLATIILFFFGLLHLSVLYDWHRALEYGLYPFWHMAMAKAGLAAAIVYSLRYYKHTDRAESGL